MIRRIVAGTLGLDQPRLFQQGKKAIQDQNFQQARRISTRLNESQRSKLLQCMVEALLQKGRTQQALKMIQEIDDMNKINKIKLKRYIGTRLLQQEKYLQALELVNEYNIQIQDELERIVKKKIKEGKLKEAFDIFRHPQFRYSHHIPSLRDDVDFLLESTFMENWDSRDARQIRQTEDFKKHFPSTLYNTGVWYTSHDNLEQAQKIASLEKALSRFQQFQLLLKIGKKLLEQGKLDQARNISKKFTEESYQARSLLEAIQKAERQQVSTLLQQLQKKNPNWETTLSQQEKKELEQHRCSTSYQVMTSPVYLTTNPKVRYQRSTIESWIKGSHPTCPTTRLQVTTTNIVPDQEERKKIVAFLQKIRDRGQQQAPAATQSSTLSARRKQQGFQQQQGLTRTPPR